MKFTFKSDNLMTYLIRAFDGVLFAVLASLLSFTVFYIALPIEFSIFPDILLSQLILWISIALVTADNKIFLLFATVCAVLALFLDFEIIAKIPSDLYDFIMSVPPSAQVLTTEIFGDFIKGFVYICVFSVLFPFFAFSKASKFSIILCIIITSAFSAVSIYFKESNVMYIYILMLPVLFLIYNRALYNKIYAVMNKMYFIYQIKRFGICTIPVTILLISINYLPTDYHSQEITDYINATTYEVFSEVEGLSRMSSRVFNIDTSRENLGGDVLRTGTVRFRIKADTSLLLTTGVFDKYTGDSFIRSYNEEIVPYTQNEDVETEFNYLSSSYPPERLYNMSIEIVNYRSNVFPVPSDVQTLQPYDENYTENQYGMVYFDDYFIAGDSFDISYFLNEDVSGLFYLLNNIDSELTVPIEATSDLPDTITDRTLELADYLAKDVNLLLDQIRVQYNEYQLELFKNYGTAAIIETYLKDNFTYALNPADTVGDDFVDSFLFESKEGNCTSFASAMYVLLRANDVPCRYVTGYSVWENNPEEFVDVTDYNKHAWVEVYIDGLGYVAFDPTPPEYTFSNEETVEPEEIEEPEQLEEQIEENIESETTQAVENTTDETEVEDSVFWTEQTKNICIAVLSVICVVCAVLFYIKYKRKYIEKVQASTDIAVVYRNLLNLLAILNIKKKENETMDEFFDRVLIFLNEKSEYDKLELYITNCVEIIEEYIYSKHKNPQNIEDLVNVTKYVDKIAQEDLMYLIKFKRIKEYKKR